MLRVEFLDKLKLLETTLHAAISVDLDFFQELLDDWFVKILALKFANDGFFWDEFIVVQERHDYLESRLPKVSNKMWDEYCVLEAMLGPLNYESTKRRIYR